MDERELVEELRELIETSEAAAFSDVTVREPREGDVPGLVLDYPRGTFRLRIVQVA
jgi:hypothetical protein